MTTDLYRQYEHNVGRSAHFVAEGNLPIAPPASPAVRLIAYYLPQFHAIAENDEWWGKGFTEWTNVSKALPRYLGHEQPRMPGDLGFYDLRDPDVLRRQAALARRGGIEGFCFHHYWFSGREILETPLRNLLANPDIDLPFCLNWANENWSRRWDGREQDILLEQRHRPGEDLAFAASILPALRDPRYIRIDGRPLLMVYRPAIIPGLRQSADRWRAFFQSEGVGDPYLVMAQTFDDEDPRAYGFDAAAGFPPQNSNLPDDSLGLRLLDRRFAGKAVSYARLVERMLAKRPDEYRLFPGVCPRWDNEPRKPGRGTSLFGTSPDAYGRWLLAAGERALRADAPDERIVFINAWNEWAEGAYLEPDRHHGYAYLAETRRTLDALSGDARPTPAAVPPDRYATARPSRLNFVRNARRVAGRIAWRLRSR